MLKSKGTLVLSILFLILSNTSFSQDYKIHGLTSVGGSNGGGNFYSLNTDGSDIEEQFSFEYPASNPGKSLIEVDGIFFGMTSDGGTHGKGVIFKIHGDGTNYEEIHSFDQLNGSNPKGALLLGNDGLLYGMTNRGGSNDKGVVFRIYTDGTEYTSLKEFDENTGKWPLGHLIQASDNKLYGMTSIGGSLGNGTIFKINIGGTSFELLKDFSIAKRPQGSLFETEDGNLYGTTAIGGSDNAGTVFKLSKDGSDFEIIHDFIGNGGPGSINPYGDLIQATDGKLYGTTFLTFGGTIFSIHPDGSGFEQLYTFNNNGGGKPQGNLIEGADSKLYGLTQEGGVNDLGSIFKIELNGENFSSLHDFSSNEGNSPHGSIIFGSDQKIYGMANLGDNASGSIFSISNDGVGHSDIYYFGSTIGHNPSGNVVTNHKGLIFGTMNLGGQEYERKK